LPDGRRLELRWAVGVVHSIWTDARLGVLEYLIPSRCSVAFIAFVVGPLETGVTGARADRARPGGTSSDWIMWIAEDARGTSQ